MLVALSIVHLVEDTRRSPELSIVRDDHEISEGNPDPRGDAFEMAFENHVINLRVQMSLQYDGRWRVANRDGLVRMIEAGAPKEYECYMTWMLDHYDDPALVVHDDSVLGVVPAIKPNEHTLALHNPAVIKCGLEWWDPDARHI